MSRPTSRGTSARRIGRGASVKPSRPRRASVRTRRTTEDPAVAEVRAARARRWKQGEGTAEGLGRVLKVRAATRARKG